MSNVDTELKLLFYPEQEPVAFMNYPAVRCYCPETKHGRLNVGMRQKLWKRDANYKGLTWAERDAAYHKIIGMFSITTIFVINFTNLRLQVWYFS